VLTIAADASLHLARHKRRAHFSSLIHGREGGVTSWSAFEASMADQPLLRKLDGFSDALLIAGCDWSATTAITRLFKRLPCFADASWSHDDELDGALLLGGLRGSRSDGRHCFQTTYVGERYREYFEHADYRLVWIVREPRAAVRSLLCSREKKFPRRTALGLPGKSSAGHPESRLERACAAYVSSICQTLELKARLGERMAVVDYDKLAADRERLLPALCRFASVGCDARLLRHLHGKSVRKGMVASWEARIIDQLAMPGYRRACVAEGVAALHAS
jgi:hypothetical protein